MNRESTATFLVLVILILAASFGVTYAIGQVEKALTPTPISQEWRDMEHVDSV